MGDCNSVATQAAVKANIGMLNLCTGNCTIDQLESYCGETAAIGRRKRRSVKQLSIKMTIKVTTTNEAALKDPSSSQLVTKMNTVAPGVLKSIQAVIDWNQKLDKNIGNLERSYNDNKYTKTCAETANIYQAGQAGKECSKCL